MKIKNALKLLLVFFVTFCLFSCDQGTTEEPSNESPVISGAADKVIEKNSKFAPAAGVTASDKEDGDLTSKIKIEHDVNPNRVGEYTVTYTDYDNDGNKTQVTIKVSVVETDSDEPIISGVSNSEIVIGSDFDALQNVSALDVHDGDLTSQLECTGTVDVWTEGSYTLTYSVKDAAGNVATVTRTVSVTLGLFGFGDNVLTNVNHENNVYSAKVSSGAINTSIESFGLTQVTFNATVTEETEISVKIDASFVSI